MEVRARKRLVDDPRVGQAGLCGANGDLDSRELDGGMVGRRDGIEGERDVEERIERAEDSEERRIGVPVRAVGGLSLSAMRARRRVGGTHYSIPAPSVKL